jgi:hypothetical protein
MRVRLADLDDADEIIRLAGLMYEAMGVDASGEAWREMAADQLRHRLATTSWWLWSPTRPCSGRLVATGAGIIAVRLPGPRNPSARVGYVQ